MWFKAEEEGADEVADIIKDEIWPDPAKYYHGVIAGEGGEEVDSEGGEE